MSAESELVTLESKTRLSDSMLWSCQAEYFDEQGIDAWSGQVPFFVTSNPYIADQYAQVTARFIQDLVRQKRAVLDAPFYILELGTGSGQFSFYCLRQLHHHLQALGLTDIKVCYVMTDFTLSNVKFWQQHPKLQHFLEQGTLDYALYNLENPEAIKLERSGVILDTNQLDNPLMVVANYIFDTVKHDVFHVKENELFEAQLTLKAKPDNVLNGKPIKLEKLKSQFSYQHLDTVDYYDDPLLNELLSEYMHQLHNGSFLMPIGAFSAIRHLATLSRQGMLILATDKAYTDTFELEGRKDPSITCHGSFSMTVNFHAIGEYCELQQGKVWHSPPSDSIRTSIFMLGELPELPEMQFTIAQTLHRCTPGDYFRLHRFLREAHKKDLRMLHTQLHLCQWDPYVLHVHVRTLSEALAQADKRIQNGFIQGIKYAAQMIYDMPGMEDYYFSLGMLLHSLQDYPTAIEFYHLSQQRFGDKFSSHYNLGICWHLIGNNPQATEHFHKADKLETSGNQQAKKWLAKISA